jgi:hypothetical protein
LCAKHFFEKIKLDNHFENSEATFSLANFTGSSDFEKNQNTLSLNDFKELKYSNPYSRLAPASEKYPTKLPMSRRQSNLNEGGKHVHLPPIQTPIERSQENKIYRKKSILKKETNPESIVNEHYPHSHKTVKIDEETVNSGRYGTKEKTQKQMNEFLTILKDIERANSILDTGDLKFNQEMKKQDTTSDYFSSSLSTNDFSGSTSLNNSSMSFSEDASYAMLKCYEDKIYTDLSGLSPSSSLVRTNTEVYTRLPTKLNTTKSPKLSKPALENKLPALEETNENSVPVVMIKTNSNLYRMDVQKRKYRMSRQIEKAMKLSDLIEKTKQNEIIRNNKVFVNENLVRAYEHWNGQTWKRL